MLSPDFHSSGRHFPRSRVRVLYMTASCGRSACRALTTADRSSVRLD
jgi:hypothetical protein